MKCKCNWKCISHVIFKISVVSGEIIFYVVSKYSVVSIVSGEMIFHVVSKISIVSEVIGEIIFM